MGIICGADNFYGRDRPTRSTALSDARGQVIYRDLPCRLRRLADRVEARNLPFSLSRLRLCSEQREREIQGLTIRSSNTVSLPLQPSFLLFFSPRIDDKFKFSGERYYESMRILSREYSIRKRVSPRSCGPCICIWPSCTSAFAISSYIGGDRNAFGADYH